MGQPLKESNCEAGGRVCEVEVMPGHVDVLVEFPLPVRLSMLVEKLKGRSLRLWRAVFAGRRRLPGLWSPSWLVSTVGGAPRGVVGRCVENQKAVA